ncbi:MAG: hypothetical protein Cpurp_01460 [Chlorogloea purpurea SAG 13.99]|nr:hypothetical protein [Chlorogloea purpurea SAG 13.99]
MKFLIGIIYTLFLILNRQKASQWRVLSAETLESFLGFPVLMTKGPRWNTHAIIGTLGPFYVKEKLTVNLRNLQQSARSWIFVVYSFPLYTTVTNLDSNAIQSGEEWYSITLPSGFYTVGLRYYDRTPPIHLPTVKVDGEIFTHSATVSPDVNNFYAGLIQNKNIFYLALHYYIFTILKYRKSLPASFIRGEYLPVGAPDTEFLYNYLSKGQSLQIEIEPGILEHYYVFFNIYDRSSLPLSWCQILDTHHVTQPIPNNGYYLFRLRPKSASATTVWADISYADTEKISLHFVTGEVGQVR